MTTHRLLAGVDVGGTKILAGLADGEGRVLATASAPTPQTTAEEVAARIAALVQEVCANADAPAALGVAVPAVTDAAQRRVLWAPNLVGWQQETSVAETLEGLLGLPTSLHYDGHAWVTGEWWCGAARGADEVVLLAVGTGIGGGVISGGRLHRGRVGVAGAVGWWAMGWSEPEEGGAPPRLEDLASGPALAEAAGARNAVAAFAAARRGEMRAVLAVESAARALGIAVANLVSLLDPEVVVLAGGVITGGADLLLPPIESIVRAEAQPQVAAQVRLVPAACGEDGGWLGAAWLANRSWGHDASCPSE